MMAASGIITNIQRCSTEDGPGIRTTLFFKGCPMRCLWCHNIETIDPKRVVVWYAVKCIGDQACVRACPEEALTMTSDGMKIDRDRCRVCGDCEDACPTGAIKIMGQIWDSDDMVRELLKDKVFFNTSGGGVTLSGGEATFQAKFALEVAKGLQENGVHVALDTCGYCSTTVMRDILKHVDLVLYDLKTMDLEKHIEYTGVPLERVLENAEVVAESGVPTWIRTPVIPKHTDSDENIRRISEFIVDAAAVHKDACPHEAKSSLVPVVVIRIAPLGKDLRDLVIDLDRLRVVTDSCRGISQLVAGTSPEIIGLRKILAGIDRLRKGLCRLFEILAVEGRKTLLECPQIWLRALNTATDTGCDRDREQDQKRI